MSNFTITNLPLDGLKLIQRKKFQITVDFLAGFFVWKNFMLLAGVKLLNK